METKQRFQCLRCEHRYVVAGYDPRVVAERSCPRCGSNSVRAETTQAEGSKPTARREGAR